MKTLKASKAPNNVLIKLLLPLTKNKSHTF